MNVTLVDLPSYVPWIVFAPALAALIQNFWGKLLPRKLKAPKIVGDRPFPLAFLWGIVKSPPVPLVAW